MAETHKQTLQSILKSCSFVLAIVLGAFALVLILISILANTWFGDEDIVTICANYEELVDSGLMNRGWLPDTIPKSVHGLRAWQNIDSNNVSATFTISIDDLDELVKGFGEMPLNELGGWFAQTTNQRGLPSKDYRRFLRLTKEAGSSSYRQEFLLVDLKTGFVRYRSQ